MKQFKDNVDVKKDLELLVSQIERCSEILKKLSHLGKQVKKNLF